MTNVIELTIKTKEAEVNLNMDHTTQDDRKHLLDIIGGVLGVKYKTPDVVPAGFLEIDPDKVVKAPAADQSKAMTGSATNPPVVTNRLTHTNIQTIRNDAPKPFVTAPVGETKQIPLGNDRTHMVSLGDKLQAAIATSGEPEWWTTGIKIDEDGTKRYKCRYQCTCGKKGNHYIPLKVEEVPCFECDAPLQVRLATGQVEANGIPERDDWGNYYVADNFYEDGEKS